MFFWSGRFQPEPGSSPKLEKEVVCITLFDMRSDCLFLGTKEEPFKTSHSRGRGMRQERQQGARWARSLAWGRRVRRRCSSTTVGTWTWSQHGRMGAGWGWEAGAHERTLEHTGTNAGNLTPENVCAHFPFQWVRIIGLACESQKTESRDLLTPQPQKGNSDALWHFI